VYFNNIGSYLEIVKFSDDFIFLCIVTIRELYSQAKKCNFLMEIYEFFQTRSCELVGELRNIQQININKEIGVQYV
jgi:hypothetical protein